MISVATLGHISSKNTWHLNTFKEMVVNETCWKIKVLQSDQGGKFISQVFVRYCQNASI
jgi:hypothetical protein